MRNIIKALKYQCRNDFFLIMVFIIMAMGIILTSVDVLGSTGSDSLVEYGSSYFMMVMLVLIPLVGRIAGWDFNDKTINYEILTGHKRKEVFFARVIVTLEISLPAALLMIAPTVLVTILNGWGNSLDMGNAVLRMVLTVFPIIRMVCEIILAVFLLKNMYAAMVLTFIVNEAVSIFAMGIMDGMITVSETVKTISSYLLTSGNMTALLMFDNGRPEYIGGEDVMVYDSTVSAGMLFGTIGVSLASIALCLWIAYTYFKKTDLN